MTTSSVGDGKTIIAQTIPNNQGFQRQDFYKPDFESLIYQRGYDVYHEPAIVCPCKIKGSDNKPDCKNCGGTGWVFLNKTRTRMLLHSMNRETKYKDWSEERMGNVSISASDKDQIGFMDKITLLNADSLHTQVLYPILYNNELISYLNYPVIEALECFMYIDSNQKLKKLEQDVDFFISGNLFRLGMQYRSSNLNPQISIRYRHLVVFHIIDITREVIVSNILDQTTGREVPTKLPLSGVGKRAHYILDWSNYSSEYLFDNSYSVVKKC
jgi:hypothetical protein